MFAGSLDAAWTALGTESLNKPLTIGEFHDALESRLGMTGPQVAEIFEVLDGPDYAAGQARISLASMRSAVEGLPEEDPEIDESDPVGQVLAAFVDGDCVVEAFSMRACGIGRKELRPITDAISKSPWQLRCLNLWDNRIADRGA